MRLLALDRVELDPRESQQIIVTADPRLLACFDGDAGQWRITEGKYTIALGKAADDFTLIAETAITGRLFGC
ncbi:MAG: fibronectin type III-like domain-contianing protein [Halobacteriota archaeon]